MAAHNQKTNTSFLGRFLRASLISALALCAMLGLSACSKEVTIADQAVDRQATSLDLRNCGITGAEPLQDLQKMNQLTALDLRDNALTIEAFDAIQAFVPEAYIRWSVPLGATRYDSESETLMMPDFSQADIAMLGYFPRLVSLDASGSADYAALIAAQTEYPAVSIRWTCSAAGKTFSSEAETIVCAKGTTFSDVATLLSALPNLKSIDLRETDVLAGDIASLTGTYPVVQFLTQAYLMGERYDTTKTSLRLDAADSFDAKMLGDQLAFFPDLTALDLRDVPATERDVTALCGRYPAVKIHWMVPVLDGLRVDSDTTSLDLRGYTVGDLAALKRTLKLFPQLTYLDMCNCGPSDEEMAQLRSELPQVKVVWMLHVGYWEIRTDIKGFSMAQYKEHEGVRFTKIGDEVRRYRWVDDEQIAKLRYCTDIEALDIGHSDLISDISFIRSLPKLRFLVISMTKVTDLSPVRTLKNLIFFEMFEMNLTDLSVLYDLPQLEYFNCSFTMLTDNKPLLSLTNLKRLWVIHCGFSDEALHALKVGLPNTIVIANGKHSTDTGWRFDNPTYEEMQALFGLPPQTDWQSAEYLLPENQIP
ncbi:MAG: hypothetical protein VB061_04030 [Christensenella sp.]|nr:hypothetical protein [Christensenella sp.]